MGGGIIFMTKENGKIHLLFGREANIESTYHKDRGKFSDFGGSTDNNETYRETAVRECVEETMGLYMNEKEINNLIDTKLERVFNFSKYRIYLVNVSGSHTAGKNKSFPIKLRDSFKKAYKNDYDKVKQHNGLYEKDMAKWFNAKYLLKNIDSFRPWYRVCVKRIIKYLKNEYKINQIN